MTLRSLDGPVREIDVRSAEGCSESSRATRVAEASRAASSGERSRGCDANGPERGISIPLRLYHDGLVFSVPTSRVMIRIPRSVPVCTLLAGPATGWQDRSLRGLGAG